MTAHNHGYDPTCKETRLPDGKMVGECMADTTNTPTPETDALSRECLNFVIDATEKDEASRLSAFAVAYHRMCVHARSLETRLCTAEAELAAMRSGEPCAWSVGGIDHPGYVTTDRADAMMSAAIGKDVQPLYRSPAPDAVVEARVWTAEDVRAALLEADRDPAEGESFADQLAKALNNLPTSPNQPKEGGQ